MDEMERKEYYKVLEKLTPEELSDAKSIVEKSNWNWGFIIRDYNRRY